MFDNHTYNLMLQLTEEHKSLWRIKNEYMQDAGDCTECRTFWTGIAKDKENTIEELGKLIKKHL